MAQSSKKVGKSIEFRRVDFPLCEAHASQYRKIPIDGPELSTLAVLMALEILVAGLLAVRDYVATHVLTCLVPAFVLAGAMVTFIDREAILDYLGEKASKLKSFSLASGSSFLVAACSCTVIPVASGLFYSGAGIGAAFIVLWVAPAANVLALIYTGNILGPEMVIARVMAALTMAFAVGFVMSYVFKPDASLAPAAAATLNPHRPILKRVHLVLIGLVVLSLLMPNYLITEGPYLYKILVWAIFTLPVVVFGWLRLSRPEIRDWLRETWWFVRTIFPLLLGGVFLVGIIGKFCPKHG